LSDQIFSTVKSAISLVDVISRQCPSITLKGKGPFLSECPHCGNHDCCSIVPPDNQGYKCHSCGKGGDHFTFIEQIRGVERSESLRIVAGWAGVELPKRREEPKQKRESKQEKVFRLALEHYESAMVADGSDGQAWFLKARGHASATLKKMRVGLATGQLLAFLKEQGIDPEDVVDAGLADKKEGEDAKPYDYFKKGWAIFPVIDSDGRILTFKSKDPDKKAPGIPLRGEKVWFLNHAALGGNELFVVEGENDGASLMDIGFDNWVGTGGGPGKDQVRLLRNNQTNKTVYLWFDKDPDKDPLKNEGGVHHTRYIYKALAMDSVNVKVIIHPGKAKDPDEFIQGLIREGKSISEVRKAVRELLSASLTPLGWELEQLRLIPDSVRRLEAFKERKLAQEISRMLSGADQEVYIKMAAEAMEISVKSVQEHVDAAGDLMFKMKNAFKDVKTADPIALAEFIYKELSNGGGGRFFKTPDKRFWLHHGRQTLEIESSNPDFSSMMQRTMHLVPVEKPGSTVLHCLKNLCNMHGEYVEMMSWLWTDRERDTIYANMNCALNKIIRLTPGQEPALVDNGTNSQSVLLSSSPQIRQFEYIQSAGEAEGFRALKELIMDTTPCESSLRYLLLCWGISPFMVNYQTDRGLMQVIGPSGTGKSKVAERLSQLIFGESYVGKGTGAAETRVATSSPMTVLDNLENRNLMQGTVDFLLFAANSANKPKAKSGSDTEVLFQKLNTLVMITSIEPFPGRLPELINRTFVLLLESEFSQHGYMHDECMREITKNRSMILSAIFKMLTKDVLPRLHERRDWSKYIQTKYPGHNKERNNEHLCTMMLILEGVLKYLRPKKDKDRPIKTLAAEILHHWISCQEEHAKETSITSDTFLMFMDGLQHEVMTKMRGKEIEWQQHPSEFPGTEVKVFDDPEYLMTFYVTKPIEEWSIEEGEFREEYSRFEFITPSPRLFELISKYYRNQNQRNPFESATGLAARIRNGKSVMESGGWEYVTKESLEQRYNTGERAKPAELTRSNNQFKKIGGHWHWRFSKKVRPQK